MNAPILTETEPFGHPPVASVDASAGEDQSACRERHALGAFDHQQIGRTVRPIADEEADARILFRVLAAIGGQELVGPAQELDSGTFYRAIPGD